jgi:ribulose bisphosphate carboxylase small subunit
MGVTHVSKDEKRVSFNLVTQHIKSDFGISAIIMLNDCLQGSVLHYIKVFPCDVTRDVLTGHISLVMIKKTRF